MIRLTSRYFVHLPFSLYQCQSPCHRGPPHGEQFPVLSGHWCRVRPAAALRPPCNRFRTPSWIAIGVDTLKMRTFWVKPGVPIPTGQVQGCVSVDHWAVGRVLSHLHKPSSFLHLRHLGSFFCLPDPISTYKHQVWAMADRIHLALTNSKYKYGNKLQNLLSVLFFQMDSDFLALSML